MTSWHCSAARNGLLWPGLSAVLGFLCASLVAGHGAIGQTQTMGAPPGTEGVLRCPAPLMNPVIARPAERMSERFAGQARSLDVGTILSTVSRELGSIARLNLSSADYSASRDLIARLDRDTVAACWPLLNGVLAQAREASSPGMIGRTAPGNTAQGFEAQRAEQASRARANSEKAQARSSELQTRSEEIEARLAARAEEARQRESDLRAREREEKARQLARQQRAREDEDRERQADLAAASDRAESLRVEASRRREVAEQEAAAERERQAVRIREQQALLAKERADAQARYLAQEQSLKLEREIDRANAERREAERIAARLQRPECREADRVAREEQVSVGDVLTPIMDIVGKLRAGMHAEACAAARKTFTAAERMRSAAARCEPAEAVPFNQLATGMREIILEQRC